LTGCAVEAWPLWLVCGGDAAVVIITSVTAIGTKLNGKFTTISNALTYHAAPRGDLTDARCADDLGLAAALSRARPNRCGRSAVRGKPNTPGGATTAAAAGLAGGPPPALSQQVRASRAGILLLSTPADGPVQNMRTRVVHVFADQNDRRRLLALSGIATAIS
jgi:hypothetical protein